MAKIIKLDFIQKNNKKFYEICSDIMILQRELDGMLAAIERNAKDFEKGKVSKELFKYNEDRMKKESAKIIKSINSSVEQGKKIAENIRKEVESQKVVKSSDKKKQINEIKKAIPKDPQEKASKVKKEPEKKEGE